MRRSNSKQHPFRKEGRAEPPRPSNPHFVSGVRGHLWFQFREHCVQVPLSFFLSWPGGTLVAAQSLLSDCHRINGWSAWPKCPVCSPFFGCVDKAGPEVSTDKSCIYPKYYAWIKEQQSPARPAAICFGSPHVPLIFEKGLGGLCQLSPPLLKPTQRLRRADESTLFSARCNTAKRGCLEDFEACIACVRSDRPRNHSRERQRGAACESRAARLSLFIFKQTGQRAFQSHVPWLFPSDIWG